MKLKQIVMVSAFVAVSSLSGNWNPDAANAKIGFSVKGPFGTVHGDFSALKATIQFNEKDLAGSSITASIETKTVSTGIGLRNADLRNKEIWFNSDKYPTINFHSKKFEKTSSGFIATGDLTIKAATKEVKIPFNFTNKGISGVFKGQFTINREDYNVGNKGGSVGNMVSITIEVPVRN